jgi:hypothetical protein
MAPMRFRCARNAHAQRVFRKPITKTDAQNAAAGRRGIAFTGNHQDTTITALMSGDQKTMKRLACACLSVTVQIERCVNREPAARRVAIKLWISGRESVDARRLYALVRRLRRRMGGDKRRQRFRASARRRSSRAARARVLRVLSRARASRINAPGKRLGARFGQ